MHLFALCMGTQENDDYDWSLQDHALKVLFSLFLTSARNGLGIKYANIASTRSTLIDQG